MASKDDGGQQRATRSTEDEAEAESQVASTDAVKERVDKIGEDVDAILDEIDEVLEENAEEFVRGYVQKGGE